MSKFVGNLEKLFFDAWCNANEDKRLYELRGSPSDVYTRTVLGSKNSIIKKVSNELCLNLELNYYGHDAVLYESDSDLYTSTKPVDQIKYNDDTWLTHFRVAFKHVKSYEGSFKELCHLLTTTADLKVLVTYPCEDGIYNSAEIEESMIDLNSIIQNSTSTTPFLVILGFPREYVKTYMDNIFWEARILEKNSFVKKWNSKDIK